MYKKHELDMIVMATTANTSSSQSNKEIATGGETVMVEVQRKSPFDSMDVLAEKAKLTTSLKIAKKKLIASGTVAFGELFFGMGKPFSMFEQVYRIGGIARGIEQNMDIFRRYVNSNMSMADKIALMASFVAKNPFNDELVARKLDSIREWLMENATRYRSVARAFAELEPEKLDDFRRADELIMQLYAIDRGIEDKSTNSDFFSGTAGSAGVSEKSFVAYYEMRKQAEELEKARADALEAMGSMIRLCEERILDEIVRATGEYHRHSRMPEQAIEDVCANLEILGKNIEPVDLHQLVLKIEKLAVARMALKRFRLKILALLEQKLLEGLLEIDSELCILNELLEMESVKDYFSFDVLHRIKKALENNKKSEKKKKNKKSWSISFRKKSTKQKSEKAEAKKPGIFSKLKKKRREKISAQGPPSGAGR